MLGKNLFITCRVEKVVNSQTVTIFFIKNRRIDK